MSVRQRKVRTLKQFVHRIIIFVSSRDWDVVRLLRQLHGRDAVPRAHLFSMIERDRSNFEWICCVTWSAPLGPHMRPPLCKCDVSPLFLSLSPAPYDNLAVYMTNLYSWQIVRVTVDAIYTRECACVCMLQMNLRAALNTYSFSSRHRRSTRLKA